MPCCPHKILTVTFRTGFTNTSVCLKIITSKRLHNETLGLSDSKKTQNNFNLPLCFELLFKYFGNPKNNWYYDCINLKIHCSPVMRKCFRRLVFWGFHVHVLKLKVHGENAKVEHSLCNTYADTLILQDPMCGLTDKWGFVYAQYC